MEWFSPLPYATAALPGIGGVIKSQPEDFEVEELPAYEPCGTGTHLFLWVEKRLLSAEGLLEHVARQLQVPRGEVGCAGLKDTQAVTRQYISVPAQAIARLPALNDPKVRLLGHKLHGNKLRTGHLRGNRFRIVVRGCGVAALPRAQAITAALQEGGLPNYYGAQRFGRDGETLHTGLKLLRGEPVKVKGFLRRLALSSVQSALYNRYLASRLADGLLHRVLAGDVLLVCASGGPFVTDDVAREQARFDAREVVPAGPMFGPKMKATQEEAERREKALLEAAGVTLEQFAAQGKLTLGTRRATLVWPQELQVEAVGVGVGDGAIAMTFTLPSGSYATGVLRELMKGEVSQGAL